MGNSAEQDCLYRLLSRKSKGEPNWECRALMVLRIEHPDLARSVTCSDNNRPEEKCAIPVVVELARRSQKAKAIVLLSS